MKFLIVLITVFSTVAWSQEFNEADPNLKIGMNNRFEASVTAPAYPGIESQVVGSTSNTCPECADPVQLPVNTTFSRDSSAVEEGDKADSQQ